MILELRDGPAIPWSAVALALSLEDRGIRLLRHDGETLRVATADGQKPELSETDRTLIAQWKQHLLAIVDYCESNHNS